MVETTLRLKDGREFTVTSYEDGQHQDGAQFMWTEGNYMCDCNRSLYIARQHGSEVFDSKDVEPFDDTVCLPCGSSITLIKLVEDGVDQHVSEEIKNPQPNPSKKG